MQINNIYSNPIRYPHKVFYTLKMYIFYACFEERMERTKRDAEIDI